MVPRYHLAECSLLTVTPVPREIDMLRESSSVGVITECKHTDQNDATAELLFLDFKPLIWQQTCGFVSNVIYNFCLD